MKTRSRPGGIQRHTLPRPPGLIECASVLDIGAGIRPMQWYRPARHVCIEPHEPYAAVLTAAGYEVLHATALEGLRTLRAVRERFEAVYLLDVIEHMEHANACHVLYLAATVATRQIVVYTPNGFKRQSHDAWKMGGEHWQTHRSGWQPGDFMGWLISLNEPEGFFAVRNI